MYDLNSLTRAYFLDHDTSISACSQFVYSVQKYNEMSMCEKVEALA